MTSRLLKITRMISRDKFYWISNMLAALITMIMQWLEKNDRIYISKLKDWFTHTCSWFSAKSSQNSAHSKQKTARIQSSAHSKQKIARTQNRKQRALKTENSVRFLTVLTSLCENMFKYKFLKTAIRYQLQFSIFIVSIKLR